MSASSASFSLPSAEAELTDAEPMADAKPDPQPVMPPRRPAVTSPRRPDLYDPLVGWSPGGTRRS
jgi:hypothetical protein